MEVKRIVFGAPLAILLLGAATEAARLGWADWKRHKATRASMEAAVQADPANAEYHAALREFAQAARLSPLDAQIRIGHGLQLESLGDLRAAEAELLLAAKLSRKYDPRWTLANFYFRRQRWTEFTKWTQDALAISYGDQSLLFDLAWSASSDANQILALVPAKLRRHYLEYLIARQRWEPAASVVVSGVSIIGTPFDWTPLQNKGVSAQGAGSVWHLEFDGNQPESCELLARIQPVQPGSTLSLHLTQRESLTTPDGAPTKPSLHWKIAAFPGISAPSDANQWTAPPGTHAARIWLTYEKPAGSMRAEGSVDIDDLRLEQLP